MSSTPDAARSVKTDFGALTCTVARRGRSGARDFFCDGRGLRHRSVSGSRVSGSRVSGMWRGAASLGRAFGCETLELVRLVVDVTHRLGDRLMPRLLGD